MSEQILTDEDRKYILVHLEAVAKRLEAKGIVSTRYWRIALFSVVYQFRSDCHERKGAEP
jgi:hypothetical protein